MFSFSFLYALFLRVRSTKKCSPATTPMSKGDLADGVPYESNKEMTRRKDVFILSHPFGNVNFHRKDVLLCSKIT